MELPILNYDHLYWRAVFGPSCILTDLTHRQELDKPWKGTLAPPLSLAQQQHPNSFSAPPVDGEA